MGDRACLVTVIKEQALSPTEVLVFEEKLKKAYIDSLIVELNLSQDELQVLEDRVLFEYRGKKLIVDFPVVKFVNGWNEMGYLPHYSIFWKSEFSSSLLSVKLSPVSFKLLFSVLQKLFSDYPFLKNSLFEIRSY